MTTTTTSHHAATRELAVQPRRRPAAFSRRTRHGFTVLSFMAPALIGILAFLVYPLLSALYFSFTKFNLLSPPAA